MSGILQNLIARHQGLAPTVEPRQRALFEPDAGAMERPALSETVAIEPYRPAAEKTGNAYAAMPTPAPTVPAFSLPTEHSPKIPPIEQQSSIRTSDRDFSETLESRLQAILARMAAAQPDAPAIIRDNGNAAETSDIERLEAMIDRLAKQTPKADSTANTEDADKTARVPPAFVVPPETRFVRPQYHDPENTSPDAPALAQPPAPVTNLNETGTLQIPDWLQALQAQLGRQTAAAAPSAAEPVVNVTIGRIEIRAGSSGAGASPAPTPRPPSGILSLDDYLKQRNTGSRP